MTDWADKKARNIIAMERSWTKATDLIAQALREAYAEGMKVAAEKAAQKVEAALNLDDKKDTEYLNRVPAIIRDIPRLHKE